MSANQAEAMPGPPPARKKRSETCFKPGNPGKAKGVRYRRTVIGIEITRALAGQAIDRVEQLIHSRSSRVAFEAARLVLAYAWGAPRQTLELTGGVGDLSRELAAALQEARARRAALGVPPVASAPAAPLSAPLAGLLAPPAEMHSAGAEPYATAAEVLVVPETIPGPGPAQGGTESSS